MQPSPPSAAEPRDPWLAEIAALAAQMGALRSGTPGSGEVLPGTLLEGLAPDGAIRAELAWLERVRVHAEALRRRGVRPGHISAVELQWLRELRRKIEELRTLRDAAHVAARVAIDACDQAIEAHLRRRPS